MFGNVIALAFMAGSVLLIIIIGLIITFSVGDSTRLTRPNAAETQTASCTLDVPQFVSQVNALRSQKGLLPVAESGGLDIVAAKRTDDMRANVYYGHINPKTRQDAGALIAEYTKFAHYGEVLDGPLKAGQAFSDFVNSPDHYAILTDANITSIGVDAVYMPGRVQTYDEKGEPITGGYGVDSCIVVAEVAF